MIVVQQQQQQQPFHDVIVMTVVGAVVAVAVVVMKRDILAFVLFEKSIMKKKDTHVEILGGCNSRNSRIKFLF